MESSPPKKFKIVLLGESGVGKTLLIHRIRQGAKNKTTFPTIGVEFTNKIYNQQNIQLNFWDTGGQQKFKSVAKVHYRNAEGIILVFSIDDKKSFIQMQKWLRQIKQVVSQQSTQIILIANKIDLQNERTVYQKQYNDFAKSQNCRLFQLSAKQDSNIEQFVQQVIKLLLTKAQFVQNKKKQENFQSVQLNNDNKEKIQKNACKCGS